MNKSKLIDGVLLVLLAVGFLGALTVSYSNLTENPCPHIWLIPICYVVLVAYGLMIVSVVVRHDGCKHYFFCAGWSVAFIIALVGTLAEIFAGGGVCPATGAGSLRGVTSGSIPMCYLSLALTIIILLLFLAGPYKRACDIHDAKASG